MHHELRNLEKFAYHLRIDDREVFEDMLLQCQLYCSHAGDMASPVKEIPLLVSIIFGQHKMILDLQRQFSIFEENRLKPKTTESAHERETSQDVEMPKDEEAESATSLRDSSRTGQHDAVPAFWPSDPSE